MKLEVSKQSRTLRTLRVSFKFKTNRYVLWRNDFDLLIVFHIKGLGTDTETQRKQRCLVLGKTKVTRDAVGVGG